MTDDFTYRVINSNEAVMFRVRCGPCYYCGEPTSQWQTGGHAGIYVCKTCFVDGTYRPSLLT